MNIDNDWPWLTWSITGPGEVWHLKQLWTLTDIQFDNGRIIPINSTLTRWSEPDYLSPKDILWAGVLRGEWVLCRPWERRQTFQELIAEALFDPLSRELWELLI